jgi:hypothetical protein
MSVGVMKDYKLKLGSGTVNTIIIYYESTKRR